MLQNIIDAIPAILGQFWVRKKKKEVKKRCYVLSTLYRSTRLRLCDLTFFFVLFFSFMYGLLSYYFYTRVDYVYAYHLLFF